MTVEFEAKMKVGAFRVEIVKTEERVFLELGSPDGDSVNLELDFLEAKVLADWINPGSRS